MERHGIGGRKKKFGVLCAGHGRGGYNNVSNQPTKTTLNKTMTASREYDKQGRKRHI